MKIIKLILFFSIALNALSTAGLSDILLDHEYPAQSKKLSSSESEEDSNSEDFELSEYQEELNTFFHLTPDGPRVSETSAQFYFLHQEVKHYQSSIYRPPIS